ncbi:YlaH-like family protein [Caldalkalibacillus mannanilyticus]|uniref:YlaH-like family protein n=1 Tax=Caldalkalibacillus mannanilyticus TaxID=1418 RepID=UPI00046887ED|nr:YlaH-like family protein [Caldalkalibacillus mannanilyticus]
MIKDWIYSYFHPEIFPAFVTLYFVIFILSAIVYKMGFARKLPILKSFVVYVALAFGCILLAFLGTGLPIPESLLLAVILLAIVKIRTRNSAPFRNRSSEEQEGRKDV